MKSHNDIFLEHFGHFSGKLPLLLNWASYDSSVENARIQLYDIRVTSVVYTLLVPSLLL